MIYDGIPADPETVLPRDQVARALTETGYPVDVNILAVLASERRGPPYVLRKIDGRGPWRACYRWGEALTWAQRHRRYQAPEVAA